MTKTQKAVASGHIPQSLVEAEQLLNQHGAIKEEFGRYAQDYARMKMVSQVVMENADSSGLIQKLRMNSFTIYIFTRTFSCFR